MNIPKVSVIVPVYNVEQHIGRCARSLFEQTLDDIEYLFINDATPDRSMEILKEILEEYPGRKSQVRIIDMPRNCGQAAVRKIGMQSVTGSYVIHCDSDDWVDRTMYEKMWRTAVGQDCDVVVCGFHYADYTGITKTKYFEKKDPSLFKSVSVDDIWPSLWNKLVKRELVDSVRYFPEDNVGEDLCLLLSMSIQCRSYSILNEALYYYFDNLNGISRQTSRLEEYRHVENNLESVIRNLDDCHKEKEMKKDLVRYACLAKVRSFSLTRSDYISIFRRVNWSFFFVNGIPLEYKLGHLTKLLGIHGISRIWKRSSANDS